MKSIKILTLLILLLGFFAVSAQQSNSEFREGTAKPTVEQTTLEQVPANQPLGGELREVQSPSILSDQSAISLTKSSEPAANDEGANTFYQLESTQQEAELQTKTRQVENSGLPADQDPNTLKPIDK